MALKIETLTREHNRDAFDCGNHELNRYLRNTARQHIDKGISRTFVLVEKSNPTEILGFFTLASCEILVEKLPGKYAKSTLPGLLLQNSPDLPSRRIYKERGSAPK